MNKKRFIIMTLFGLLLSLIIKFLREKLGIDIVDTLLAIAYIYVFSHESKLSDKG